MRSWGYVFLCLILPLAWGVVSARVFDRYQTWRQKRVPVDAASDEKTDDREMYYI